MLLTIMLTIVNGGSSLTIVNETTNFIKTVVFGKKVTCNFIECRLTWSLTVVGELKLGFPPEFRVTVYVRKWSRNFFHFHYGKGSGKSEFRNDFRNDLFSVKRKFPERCSGISFRKFPVSGTIGTIITLKSYICKYNTS